MMRRPRSWASRTTVSVERSHRKLSGPSPWIEFQSKSSAIQRAPVATMASISRWRSASSIQRMPDPGLKPARRPRAVMRLAETVPSDATPPFVGFPAAVAGAAEDPGVAAGGPNGDGPQLHEPSNTARAVRPRMRVGRRRTFMDTSGRVEQTRYRHEQWWV